MRRLPKIAQKGESDMSKSKVSNTVRGDNSASWLKRFFHSGIILYIILIVLAVIYIMPFVTQIATSF